MKVENLKDLKALIALCQKSGVAAITIDGIQMNFIAPQAKARASPPMNLDMPPEYSAQITVDEPYSDKDLAASGDLNEEQRLFYSAQGYSENLS